MKISQLGSLEKEITVVSIKEILKHKDMGFNKGINSPRC
jgi:hypothetical protein